MAIVPCSREDLHSYRVTRGNLFAKQGVHANAHGTSRVAEELDLSGRVDISSARINDQEWLTKLVDVTTDELPLQKEKASKRLERT
jgi:hypothetical protein